MKKRIMLDTNVMKGALIGTGIGREVFLCLIHACHTLVVTPPLEAEYKKTLGGKERIRRINLTLRYEFDKLKAIDSEKFEYVDPVPLPNVDLGENDQHLVECAVGGQCDYLISMDRRHVLSHKKIERTTVMSPEEFLSLECINQENF